ncbi:dihydroorotate dehydrogenase electron transfer subunit [Thermodesulfobacteriota bacterium]
MIDLETAIIFNKKVASGTFLMGIRSEEMAVEARPGQFVMIRVRSGIDPLLRRPFSICAVRGGDLLLILYRVVGKGTRIMSEAGKGEKISILGPLGRGFELPEKGGDSLLISGGIGVAPLVFLSRVMKKDSPAFLMGYRSSNELVLLEEVGLSGENIHISTDDGTAGYHGFVTGLLARYLRESKKKPSGIFVCGPLPMMKKAVEISANRGIPCQVSLESSMACGIGACQGCAVKSAHGQPKEYLHVCQDGPVFDAAGLNWDRL